MDLRRNKDAGYLPRSHLIDTSNINYENISNLVDEFAKLKGLSHFILMTSKFNSKPKGIENILYENTKGKNGNFFPLYYLLFIR